MNKKLFLILGIVGFLALAGSSIFTPVSLADTDEKTIPEKNLVTMVDLGAKKCIPCKMMAPILVELKKEYAGRAAVIFIDVWEYPDKAQEFKVSIIPTQIFL